MGLLRNLKFCNSPNSIICFNQAGALTFGQKKWYPGQESNL